MSEMTEMDSSEVSPEVARIAEQAKEISQKRNGRRADTLFYKVVLGGNMKVTSEVVNYMEQTSMEETLNWLLKRNHFEDKKHSKTQSSRRLFLIRLATFLILSVISTLLTPIFYIGHILTNAFFNQRRKRIADDISLPLAFAAFSQDAELMQYVLSLGVDAGNIDEHGNNVFHYIADLSSVAGDNACRIFSSTVNFIDDSDMVHELLIKNRNSSGHTAMEYAVKFGSPILQMQILKQPNLLQHTAFAVGKQEVRFDDNTESKEHPASLPDASTHLEYVDVTMYEAGTLADQSTILNLLSDRSVDKMSSEELKIFNPANFAGTWINLKVRQLLPGVVIMHVMDFIVTILLLIVIYTSDSGTSGNSFSEWKDQQEWDAIMTEVGKFADDGFGTVLKPDAHKRALAELQQEMKMEYLPDLIDNPGKKTLLFNTTIKTYTNVSEYYNGSEANWVLTDVDTPIWIIDAFYNSALELIEFRDSLTLIHVALNFIDVSKEFAKQIKKDHAQKKDHITLQSYWGFRTICGTVYDDFTTTYKNEVIIPKEIYSCFYFQSAFCVRTDYFIMSDIQETKALDDIAKTVKNIISTCNYKIFVDLATSNICGSYRTSTLFEMIYSYSESRINIALSHRLIHIASILYIALDIIERCVFMYTCVCKQSSVLQMFSTALSHKLPGSYARKQINVSTYLGLLVTFIIDQLSFKSSVYKTIPYYQVNLIYGLIKVLCTIFRFLMHIHTLRLVPGIGHFVITTFMMGTNLIHFSTIFGIVWFIFSVLFHILIDDQSCPIEKAAGFETIQASMFSTFKLTFGHGEFEPFYSTTPVKLTYTLYVIIVGLLLMNLIIAIMSTTATDIMADPWKDALWNVEWLDEATSAEYTFSILGLPLRRFTNLNLFLHERVGYVVKKMNDKRSKVYVEVFHCHATEVTEM